MMTTGAYSSSTLSCEVGQRFSGHADTERELIGRTYEKRASNDGDLLRKGRDPRDAPRPRLG